MFLHGMNSGPATSYTSAMVHVTDLRCERCGAPADASTPPWIRCTSCGRTVGFDFTSTSESPEMANFLRRSMQDPQRYVKLWNEHEAALQKAVAVYAKSPDKALDLAAKRAEFILKETPWCVAPQVKHDARLRAAYLRWIGFDLLHLKLPGRYQTLHLKLNEATAAIGFGANENPLPAFESMLDILREMLEARYEAGSPPDPEDLSLRERQRLTASQMVASYIRLVSPELQLVLLRKLYGDDAVGGMTGPDYSVYFDWECPQCGLYSPQGPTADKLTCPGCYCSRHQPAASLEAIGVICHGCGAPFQLAARQLHATCEYCGSQVARFVRPGDAQREVLEEFRRGVANQYGLDYAEAIADSNGFGCTPETRPGRLRDGLVRIAQWYNKFITPARMAGFAWASVNDASQAATLLAAAQQANAAEQGPEAATKLLAAAHEKLS